ncbi:MAG: hypothetical protein ACOCRK_03980 [bacterium]
MKNKTNTWLIISLSFILYLLISRLIIIRFSPEIDFATTQMDKDSSKLVNNIELIDSKETQMFINSLISLDDTDNLQNDKYLYFLIMNFVIDTTKTHKNQIIVTGKPSQTGPQIYAIPLNLFDYNEKIQIQLITSSE